MATRKGWDIPLDHMGSWNTFLPLANEIGIRGPICLFPANFRTSPPIKRGSNRWRSTNGHQMTSYPRKCLPFHHLSRSDVEKVGPPSHLFTFYSFLLTFLTFLHHNPHYHELLGIQPKLANGPRVTVYKSSTSYFLIKLEVTGIHHVTTTILCCNI